MSDKRVITYIDYTQSHAVVTDRPTIVVEFTDYSAAFSTASDVTQLWIQPDLSQISIPLGW